MRNTLAEIAVEIRERLAAEFNVRFREVACYQILYAGLYERHPHRMSRVLVPLVAVCADKSHRLVELRAIVGFDGWVPGKGDTVFHSCKVSLRFLDEPMMPKYVAGKMADRLAGALRSAGVK